MIFVPASEPDVALSARDLARLSGARVLFDPDQVRAEDGKWTDGGGGSSESVARASGIPRRGHLDKMSQVNAAKQIFTDGQGKINEVEAEKIQESVDRYSGSGQQYLAVRNNPENADHQRLERLIDLLPKWPEGSPLFRGAMISGTRYTLVPGATVTMGGISSWTSTRATAVTFAGEDDDRAVIFVLPKTALGTSIRHLSAAYKENEVLVSSRAAFKVQRTYRDARKTFIVELAEVASP